MLDQLKRIVVVTGHYGSGKTNLAVNLAMDLRSAGKNVVLVDLDIVNPYFRSADFADLAAQNGVELIAPTFAGTNLDIPALTSHLDAAIDTDKQLVIDVGGDDVGAAALGRYSAMIREAGGCDMLYVVNGYRYLTRSAEEAEEILEQIQQVSRMTITGVVNNSNLAEITAAQDVAEKDAFARETARKYGVPMLFTSAGTRIAPQVRKLISEGEVYPVQIYVKKPWDA